MSTYTKHSIEIGQFCYSFTSIADVNPGSPGSYFEPPDPGEVEIERFEFDSAQRVPNGETYDSETYPFDVEEVEKMLWLYFNHNPDESETLETEILESFDPSEFYDE